LDSPVAGLSVRDTFGDLTCASAITVLARAKGTNRRDDTVTVTADARRIGVRHAQSPRLKLRRTKVTRTVVSTLVARDTLVRIAWVAVGPGRSRRVDLAHAVIRAVVAANRCRRRALESGTTHLTQRHRVVGRTNVNRPIAGTRAVKWALLAGVTWRTKRIGMQVLANVNVGK